MKLMQLNCTLLKMDTMVNFMYIFTTKYMLKTNKINFKSLRYTKCL